MGNLCMSCCNQTVSCEDLTPDVEIRRKQQMEAAQRRIAEQQTRGIKNIESVKRQEWRDQQREKREETGNTNLQNTLKWQMN